MYITEDDTYKIHNQLNDFIINFQALTIVRFNVWKQILQILLLTLSK